MTNAPYITDQLTLVIICDDEDQGHLGDTGNLRCLCNHASEVSHETKLDSSGPIWVPNTNE